MRPTDPRRIRVFAFALGFAVLLAGQAVAGPPPYRLQWGTQGSGDGQFLNPAGLAVDAAGNVYVADHGNSRVQKFASDGTFLLKFGMGELSSPIGVAIDPDGSIFVLEYWGHRVSRFNSSGVYQGSFGTFGGANGNFLQPRAIGIDPSGNIYVCDGDWQTVQKFANDGTFLARFGTPGAAGNANGQFSTPWGVAADASGSIYVSDTGNNRVQKLNSATGAFIGAWGTLGSGNGQFNQPQNLTVGADGLVYVVDRANSRIQRFTSSGMFVDAWGSNGAGPHQFNGPLGVALDAAGTTVYVADSDNHRIVAFGCGSPAIAPRLPSMRTWWRLDETAGTTAADFFDAVPLTNVGTPAHNAGTLVNNSLNLTGAAYLEKATPGAAVDVGTGDYSLETWYRSSNTSTPVRTIVDHRSGSRGYSVFISFGHLGTQMADGAPTNFTSGGASLNDGAWHHLVASVQRGSATGGNLYVDGNPVLTFNPTVRPGTLSNAGSFRIGQAFDNSSASLNGDLDEVGLYASALTEAEVQAAFCAGALGRSCGTPVTISVQPIAVNAVADAYVTFKATASGTPPLEYQWEKNGVPLEDAGFVWHTDSTELVIGHALVGDVGDYRVRVTNPCGSTYSDAAHLAVCTPPTVSFAFPSGYVYFGQPFTLQATSNGLHWQWRRNGVNVGTDSKTYTVVSAAEIDHGYYDVVATNDCGSATSALVMVHLWNCPPALELQANLPADVNDIMGNPATFAVNVTAGCLPATYTWLKDNRFFSRSNAGNPLTIPSTTPGDAGVYQCHVSSPSGERWSRVASLNIAGPVLTYDGNNQSCTTMSIDWGTMPAAVGTVFYSSNSEALSDSTTPTPLSYSGQATIPLPTASVVYYKIRVVDAIGRTTLSPLRYVWFPSPDPNNPKLSVSPIVYATWTDDFGPSQGLRVGIKLTNLGCAIYPYRLVLNSLYVGNTTPLDPATNVRLYNQQIVQGLGPLQSAISPVECVFKRSELGTDYWYDNTGSGERYLKGTASIYTGFGYMQAIFLVKLPVN